MTEDELSSAYRRTVKETLLLMLSGILAVSVTLLAYRRLLDSNWTLAPVDTGFVAIMLLLFLFVYVGRKTRAASILIALGFIGASLISVLLLGESEIFWAFPALMVAYFMLDARQATILTGGFAGCFLAIVWDDLSAIEIIKIWLALVVTVLLANAFSLTNRRQMEELRRTVHLDPLTGAGNRRAQDLKLESTVAIFRRHHSPASLLMIDIDHFKRINDTRGHMVGDQVLIAITELIGGNTRATESLYRCGGEEFVLVAEQTELKAAVGLAEKVRRLVEQETFLAGIQVTVSIGVAQLQSEEDREAWLSRADAALYRAKGQGRNRVIVAGAPKVSRLPTVQRSDEPEAMPVLVSHSM
ncbi:putative diguanylate cyclase DgcC [Halioglobus japonicus]|nr:putative diguanylate cyclase DgcC [Halioglobus japonicus]